MATAFLLTPRAAGGIAVVSLTGDDRHEVAAALLGGAPVDHDPRRRWLTVAGERIDEAVVFTRPDRHSIELHVHGSLAVLAALETVLGPLTAPQASARELLLRRCESEAQLEFALEQTRLLAAHGGSFVNWVAAHARTPEPLHAALAGRPLAKALAEPCRIVLIGRKNAGKSTLMNRLLFHDRVLAGPEPGLTRDPVREVAVLGGYPYEVVDTAGEGEPADDLDRAAIGLARHERSAADTVLVVDGTVGVAAIERALLARHVPLLTVRTKNDLRLVAWPGDLPPPIDVSCRDAEGAAAVRAAVGTALRRRRELPPAGPAGCVVAIDAGEEALVAAALDRLRA